MDTNEIREKYRRIRNESTGSSPEERGKRAAYSDFICMTYEVSNKDIEKMIQEFIENEDISDNNAFMSSKINAYKEILADVMEIK